MPPPWTRVTRIMTLSEVGLRQRQERLFPEGAPAARSSDRLPEDSTTRVADMDPSLSTTNSMSTLPGGVLDNAPLPANRDLEGGDPVGEVRAPRVEAGGPTSGPGRAGAGRRRRALLGQAQLARLVDQDLRLAAVEPHGTLHLGRLALEPMADAGEQALAGLEDRGREDVVGVQAAEVDVSGQVDRGGDLADRPLTTSWPTCRAASAGVIVGTAATAYRENAAGNRAIIVTSLCPF